MQVEEHLIGRNNLSSFYKFVNKRISNHTILVSAQSSTKIIPLLLMTMIRLVLSTITLPVLAGLITELFRDALTRLSAYWTLSTSTNLMFCVQSKG